jgi:hypothetical protein
MKHTRIFRSPFSHMRQNVVAYLALFMALGGTSAYAANEWTGANIVDESLTGADIKNGAVASRDVTNASLTGADVLDNTIGAGDITNGSLSGLDIADASIGLADIGSQTVGADEVVNDSLLQSDIRAGAVTSDEVLDNSLIGADINESTLSLPPTTTATFAGGNVAIPHDGTFVKVTGKFLPAGSYAIAATANVRIHMGGSGNPAHRDAVCELRDMNGAFIGGARDRRSYPTAEITTASLSMNGGVQVPAGGGEVGLYCRYQPDSFNPTADGQMMIIRLDGFS